MTRSPKRAAARGMTILELLFVVAISSVVIAGITKVVIDMMRTNQARQLSVEVQGEGRDSLGRLEANLRMASLGATLGVIVTQDAAGTVVQRPAVQIYDNVTARNAHAMGGRTVKAGTDALLVVAGRTGGAQTQVWASEGGNNVDSTGPLYVTTTTGFVGGDPPTQRVLVGPYLAAGWGAVTQVEAADVANSLPVSLRISSGTTNRNVFPGGKVGAGSVVREAQARLYFVNDRDELASVVLAFPRAPASTDEVLGYEVLATGVENLQVECEIDLGRTFGACPAAAVDTEGDWALGAEARSRVGVGTDTRANAGAVRNVILSVVVRSPRPVRDQRGDPQIAIGGQSLGPLAYDPTTGQQYQLGANDAFLRRAYRVPVAIRNTSLGVY